MDLGDRLETLRFLVHDRDPLFAAAFGEVFTSEGLRIIATLPQTPRMNAICERVIGTLRREILDRLLVLGECHLALMLREYLVHYNGHRPHQSRLQLPWTSTRSRSVIWPTCDPYAENPSSRE
jgi:putative transposase